MDRYLPSALLLLLCAVALAKQGRTYYDDAWMARVQWKIEQHEWARGRVEAARAQCEWLVGMSDQELWDFIPPPEQMRAINVHIAHDCPRCGDEVNRKAGHYPWIISRDLPFKVKCPVCGTVFPENDFQPWNTEGLEGKPAEGPGCVDEGIGWLDVRDGRRYYFVPYYVYWQRWARDILGGLRDLRAAYLLTGEPIYAHKAGLMLAKIGSEYDRFDYRVQCYHEGKFNINGRISDRIWSTGDDTEIAQTYDAIYPALAEDEQLREFLALKGIDDARQTIEDTMLFTMVRDVMSGYVAGNMGMHQVTLATLAIVLDNDDPDRGPTTADMREWLMSGPGRIEDLLWNGFTREGLGAEASPGYSSLWCKKFYEMAELLPKLGVDIWSIPRLKKMADIGIDLTIAGRFAPSIGDSGGIRGSGPIALSPQLQGLAFTHYGDPRHALALVDMGAGNRDLLTDYFDEQRAAEVAAATPRIELQTRDLGGYGLAILETGKGEDRRALSLYYGDASGGHGHYDRLNVEMFAYGQVVLSEDGYPTPFTRPDFHQWRRADTHKHYCVMVDELPQLNLYRGDLHSLVSLPELQMVDASAEGAYEGIASLYRRTSSLIDISPERSYLLDIFRVRGGGQHDWCFHGPGFPQFQFTGGDPGPVQAKGTLAGEDVEYGQKPPARASTTDIPVDLAGAEGVLTGDEHYRVLGENGFTPHVAGVVTYKVGSELRCRLPRLEAGRYKLLLQYWDHKPSSSELELTLGPTVIPVVITTEDRQDYRWMGQVIDLPQAAETLKLAVKSTERNYVMINRMVISRDLQAEQPAVPIEVSSGFQGLFNVRRLQPQAGWGATWSNPDANLNVTLTVPAGCAQEVIIADGEPEAQVGNPHTIEYLLGRNRGEDLLSKYVAVVEPHQGPAAVSDVTLLAAEAAAPETVGVRVEREGAVDLIHSALDATQQTSWSGLPKPLSVRAEYAVVTVDDQGVQRAMLVGGGRIEYGDFSLEAADPPRGKVLSVDPGANTITIDAALPAVDPFIDRVIIIGNELRRTSHTIKSVHVEGDTTTLGFGDLLFVIGMNVATGFDEGASIIRTQQPVSGYGKIEGGRHSGRWLYNEDYSQCCLIQAVAGQTLTLSGVDGTLESIYTDADGDGRRRLWISDIGPNDGYRIPTACYVTRIQGGGYRVEGASRAGRGSGQAGLGAGAGQ